MRLPTDILLSILAALPRETLDAVAISNRLLGVLCTTHYSAYPLREANLTVDCLAGTASVVDNEDETDHLSDAKYYHTDFEGIGRYLSQATLIYLSISGPVDERILDLLLPFKDRFRELFFCHSLPIKPLSILGSPPDVNGANARFLTLPCVQQCSCVSFENMPNANAGDIIAWLTREGHKSLIMQGTPHDGRDEFVHELIDKIVEQFRSASSASIFYFSYKAYGTAGITAAVHENTATSEKLVVSLEHRSFYYEWVTIRRSKR